MFVSLFLRSKLKKKVQTKKQKEGKQHEKKAGRETVVSRVR